MIDIKFCKVRGFNYTVKAKIEGQPEQQDIPECPDEASFTVESSGEKVVVWIDPPDAPGNAPWVFSYEQTAPQSVNVTIGGDE
jgi:hypothetical protein